MPGPLKSSETLKYHFTHDELWEKSKVLAHLSQELGGDEDAKKSIMAELNARISEKKAQMHKLSIHINNGYEMRQVDIEIWYNRPESGYKTVIRLDSGEIVREAPMSVDEKQRHLPFDMPEEVPPDEAPTEEENQNVTEEKPDNPSN